MYKDAREELQRLEDALLQEELQETDKQDEADELDVLLAETRRLVGLPENPEEDPMPLKEDLGETRVIYNTDRTEGNLDALSDELLEEPQQSLAGLMVTAGVLCAGIVAIIIWWLVRLGGLF